METESRVSLQDVRTALSDTDPHKTNAGKLRELIGRGSLATVQKYLEILRSEKIAAQQPQQAQQTPEPPSEWDALWAPVYTSAVAVVRGRLDAVVSERDALATALTASHQDVKALIDQAAEQDRAAAADAAARAADAAVIDSHAGELAQRAVAAAEAATAHQAAIGAWEARLSNAAHELEIERRDHALTKSNLQTTIERLTDRMGDLKSLLHDRPEKPKRS